MILRSVMNICLLLCLTAAVWAQTTESEPLYRFINTQQSSTLEKELNQNAAEGWRLLLLPKAFSSDTMGALLKKPANSEIKHEYKVLAAKRIGTLENEFKAAIAEGFDYRGIITTDRVFVGNETLLVLEREVGQKTSHNEYQFLNTKKESTLQKEMESAASQGYVPVGFTRTQDNSVKQQMFGIMAGSAQELTLILSRNREKPATEMGREYRVLTTQRLGTLEKEINQAAKEGYHFHYAAPTAITIMARDSKTKSVPVEYKVLGTNRVKTMEKEMNEMSAEGYRYCATSTGAGGLATVFERQLKSDNKAATFDIKLLTKLTDSSVNKEIQKLVDDGYELMDVTNLSNFLLILQKTDEK